MVLNDNQNLVRIKTKQRAVNRDARILQISGEFILAEGDLEVIRQEAQKKLPKTRQVHSITNIYTRRGMIPAAFHFSFRRFANGAENIKDIYQKHLSEYEG